MIDSVGEMRHGQQYNMLTFKIKVAERWTNRSGEVQERQDIFEWVAFNDIAEQISENLQPGNLVMIDGKAQSRQVKSKQGNMYNVLSLSVQKYDIIGIIDKPALSNSQNRRSNQQSQPKQQQQQMLDEFDDDIPF